MFGSAIIVFRETLEAALIIGIIAAATHQVPGRNRWLASGLLAGLFGAGLVAAATGEIAEMASGVGQELFNAAILCIAVLMLAWHNIWMSSHGKDLASKDRKSVV
jgi:high-affinity iron transporter